ncbi:MAG: hypothetical protein II992_10660 [Lachnospiraceae bacterium]|nr:hypothetical protein [Lachnospiraceae bacterium]
MRVKAPKLSDTSNSKGELIMTDKMMEGRIFLKTRKADVNVEKMLNAIQMEAEQHGIMAEEALIDRGNSRDLDRDCIGELLDTLLSEDVQALIVMQVGDITDDIHDLVQFMLDAEACGVAVYSMDLDFRKWNNPGRYKSEENLSDEGDN